MGQFEKDMRRADIMIACFDQAARMTDEQLDAAVEAAKKASDEYPREPRKRFLFWSWQPDWSQGRSDAFSRWFYFCDARKHRRFRNEHKLKLGDVSSPDTLRLMSDIARSYPDEPLVKKHG